MLQEKEQHLADILRGMGSCIVAFSGGVDSSYLAFIANRELGTIEQLSEKKMRVRLCSGKRIEFSPEQERHFDHGYAVTSHSSQGTTVDRVLVNADTRESEMLLNDRMGYVAISRARENAIIYTNSIEELRSTLERRVDKDMAIEAVRETEQHRHDFKNDQSHYDDERRHSLETDQGHEQDLTNDTTSNRAAEAIEVEEMEFSFS